jgi:hypothetical protein
MGCLKVKVFSLVYKKNNQHKIKSLLITEYPLEAMQISLLKNPS